MTQIKSAFIVVLLLCLPAAAYAQESSAVFGEGSVIIGYDNRTCTGALAGSIRYNSSFGIEFCNGSAWVSSKQPRCQDDDTGECYLDATRSNDDPEFTAANIADGTNILGVTGTLSAGGDATSKLYTSPGTTSFTVPEYTTLVVEVWGGGGAGAASYFSCYTGGHGNASSFGSVTANGGTRGSSSPGSGGSASGGDVNISGSDGSGESGGDAGGPGGGSGGASTGEFGDGPGGGGAGDNCDGGGGGGYAKKTYSAGDLTVGSSVTVTVGSGGQDVTSANGNDSGAGANGMVLVVWW